MDLLAAFFMFEIFYRQMVEHLNCLRFYVRINCTVDKHCNILCCSYKYFTIPAAEKYVLYSICYWGNKIFFLLITAGTGRNVFPWVLPLMKGGGGSFAYSV